MGKRELILVAAFVLVGAVVYQFTAPPSAPGEQGFSISRLINEARREIGGRRASAQATTSTRHPVTEAVTELRVVLTSGPITIAGEERDDVDASLAVQSNAYEAAEAEATAKQTVVKFELAGSILFARVEYPREGIQTASLTLKVPSRLRVRIEGNRGKLDIRNIAGLELGLARGEANISQIRGRAVVSHRGGPLVVSDVASLKLTARGSDARLERVQGEVTVSMQAGELKASGLAGPLELESNGTAVEIAGMEKTTGSTRLNVTGGSVSLQGLQTESRIDVRGATVDLVLARAALIAVYSEGDEGIALTAPPTGFRLNAMTSGGAIAADPAGQLEKWGLAITDAEGGGKRVAGDVNGGGALITLRSQQGNITLKANSAPAVSSRRSRRSRQ